MKKIKEGKRSQPTNPPITTRASPSLRKLPVAGPRREDDRIWNEQKKENFITRLITRLDLSVHNTQHYLICFHPYVKKKGQLSEER